MKKTTIIFFAFLSLSSKFYSQDSKISYDSSLNIWNDTNRPDSIRYSALFNHIVNMTYENADSSFHYIKVMYNEAKEKDQSRYVGWSVGLKSFVYEYLNQPIKALESIKKAKSIYKKFGYKVEMGYTNNTLGKMYRDFGDWDMAHQIFLENYRIGNEINDTALIAISLLNMGKNYSWFGMVDSSIYCSRKCIELVDLMNSNRFMLSYKAMAIQNLGHAYFKTDFEKTLKNYNESKNLMLELNNTEGAIDSYIWLGILYYYYKMPDSALKNFLIAQKMEVDEYGEESELTLSNLYKVYKKLNDFEKAISTNDKYLFIRDSSKNSNTNTELFKLKIDEEFSLLREIDSIKYSNEILLNQAKAKAKDEEIKAQKRLELGMLFIIILIVGFLYFVFKQLKTTKAQKLLIEHKQKEISDSINYAKRIQDAMMTSSANLREVLVNHFIFYQPKDVVSGDFYWAHKNNKGDVFFTVADCTGHGVPGAFMSMIGTSMLNEIIVEKGIYQTDQILANLRDQIIKALKQEETDSQKDGMDIALCKLNINKRELEFSGAMNPLIHVSGDNLNLIKGDPQPIGYSGGKNKAFTIKKLKLKKNDMLYISSDGFQDQFGGPKGKKYRSMKFRNFLKKQSTFDLKKQKMMLENEFNSWKENYDQLDDVCVMGVRIT